MIDGTDNEDVTNTAAVNDTEAGASQSAKGRSGKGKSEGGAGSGGLSKLLPHKLKEIMSNWEHLDANKVVARMAEFFSEGIARASANMIVDWASLSKHGYTLINDAIAVGSDLGQFARERTRDGMRKVQKRLAKYGLRLAVKPNPTAG
jgi:hypothetical protein